LFGSLGIFTGEVDELVAADFYCGPTLQFSGNVDRRGFTVEQSLFVAGEDDEGVRFTTMVEHGVKRGHAGAVEDEVVVEVAADVGEAFGRIEGIKTDAALRVDDFELILCGHRRDFTTERAGDPACPFKVEPIRSVKC